MKMNEVVKIVSKLSMTSKSWFSSTINYTTVMYFILFLGFLTLNLNGINLADSNEIDEADDPGQRLDCATTKVSFENFNFDYTWRILGLMKYLAYIKKFRHEFSIQYEKFKLQPTKFSGDWRISLSNHNLTLEYERNPTDSSTSSEAETNFICFLEIVVEVKSKVFEFKHSKQVQKHRNFNEGSEDTDNNNIDEDGETTTKTKPKRKIYSTTALVWFNFGDDLINFINSSTKQIDIVDIIFHIQAFRSNQFTTSSKCSELMY